MNSQVTLVAVGAVLAMACSGTGRSFGNGTAGAGGAAAASGASTEPSGNESGTPGVAVGGMPAGGGAGGHSGPSGGSGAGGANSVSGSGAGGAGASNDGAGGAGASNGGAGGAGASNGGAGSSSGGTGGSPSCRVATDCPAAQECVTPICVAGVCGVQPVVSGTAISTQTAADCKRVVCDGNGSTKVQADATDVPNDHNDCTVDSCVGSTPASVFVDPGVACSGGVCNGQGVCGVCKPTTRRCSANLPQLCGANGQWLDQTACGAGALTCSSGVCTGPRCAGVPATCGPSANESCCASPLVTGSSFFRDYDGLSFLDKTHPATVANFRLDRFETTVGRYRTFMDAGLGVQGSPPAVGAGAHSQSTGWIAAWNTKLLASRDAFASAAVTCSPSYRTWSDLPGNAENNPINCVTWYEAFAFCAWDGGFLPTEAEWDYAAAGGTDQRVYPWSEAIANPVPTPIIDLSYAWLGQAGASLVGLKSPKGDGKWNQADLLGNVTEWLLDSYVSPYAIASCNNCSDQSSQTTRALRGSDSAQTSGFEISWRDGWAPESRFSSFGFRCARVP